MGRSVHRVVLAAVPVLVLALVLGAAPGGRPATGAAPAAPSAGTEVVAGRFVGAATGTGAWDWPLRPRPAVVEVFRAPSAPWLPGHRGVDLAAAPGAVVLSPADGVVTFTGTVVERGVLVLTHPGGLRTSLEPVSATLARGEPVARGQPVAVLQTPEQARGHCAPASCLHWGVRRGEAYLDPLSLLGPPAPAVLLPLARVGGVGGGPR